MTDLLIPAMAYPTAALLLKATAVLAAAWIAHAALAASNPRWRVALWRGVALSLPVLALLTFHAPSFDWQVLPAALQVPLPSPEVPPMLVLTTIPPQRIETPDRHVSADEIAAEPVLDWPYDPAMTKPVLKWPGEAQSLSIPLINAPLSIQTANDPGVSPPLPQQAPRLLLIGWLAGSAIAFLRCFAPLVKVRRLIRQASPAAAAQQQQLLTVASRLGLSRLPRLLVFGAPIPGFSPFLAGIRRPTIVLPPAMVRPEFADELPGVLAHELAHIQGADLAWMALLRAVRIVLWWHPFAWRIGAAHGAACERVCDAVAAQCAGPEQYSRTLAQVALELSASSPALGLPLARPAQIRRRLAWLARGATAAPLSRLRGSMAALLSFGVVLTLGCLRLTESPPAPVEHADAPMPSAEIVSPSGGNDRVTREFLVPQGEREIDWPAQVIHASGFAEGTRNGDWLIVECAREDVARVDAWFAPGGIFNRSPRERLDIQSYSLAPPRDAATATSETVRSFQRGAVEAIRVFLYAEETEFEAATEGRRLWFDGKSAQLTIVDTPQNLQRAREYVASLPQMEIRRPNVTPLRTGIAPELTESLEAVLAEQATKPVDEIKPERPHAVGRPIAAGSSRDADELASRPTDPEELRRPAGSPMEAQKVVTLKHADAVELAGALNKILHLTTESLTLGQQLSLRRGEERVVGDIRMRLVRVEENDSSDRNDDAAQISVNDGEAILQISVGEHESQTDAGYVFHADSVEPASGRPGNGSARITVTRIPKDEENLPPTPHPGISITPSKELNLLVIRYANAAMFQEAMVLIAQLDQPKRWVSIEIKLALLYPQEAARLMANPDKSAFKAVKDVNVIPASSQIVPGPKITAVQGKRAEWEFRPDVVELAGVVVKLSVTPEITGNAVFYNQLEIEFSGVPQRRKHILTDVHASTGAVLVGGGPVPDSREAVLIMTSHVIDGPAAPGPAARTDNHPSTQTSSAASAKRTAILQSRFVELTAYASGQWRDPADRVSADWMTELRKLEKAGNAKFSNGPDIRLTDGEDAGFTVETYNPGVYAARPGKPGEPQDSTGPVHQQSSRYFTLSTKPEVLPDGAVKLVDIGWREGGDRRAPLEFELPEARLKEGDQLLLGSSDPLPPNGIVRLLVLGIAPRNGGTAAEHVIRTAPPRGDDIYLEILPVLASTQGINSMPTLLAKSKTGVAYWTGKPGESLEEQLAAIYRHDYPPSAPGRLRFGPDASPEPSPHLLGVLGSMQSLGLFERVNLTLANGGAPEVTLGSGRWTSMRVGGGGPADSQVMRALTLRNMRMITNEAEPDLGMSLGIKCELIGNNSNAVRIDLTGEITGPGPILAASFLRESAAIKPLGEPMPKKTLDLQFELHPEEMAIIEGTAFTWSYDKTVASKRETMLNSVFFLGHWVFSHTTKKFEQLRLILLIKARPASLAPPDAAYTGPGGYFK